MQRSAALPCYHGNSHQTHPYHYCYTYIAQALFTLSTTAHTTLVGGTSYRLTPPPSAAFGREA